MVYRIIFSLLLTAFMLQAKSQIKIVDSINATPIQDAYVFMDDGRYLGASDNKGCINLPQGYSGSITIQHICYELTKINSDSIKDNIVKMKPFIYTLPEVTSTYENPDYLVLTVYTRCYTMKDSIPAYYEEGIYDYYISMKKNRTKYKTIVERKLLKPGLGDYKDVMIVAPLTLMKLRKDNILIKWDGDNRFDNIKGDSILSIGKRGSINGVKKDDVRKTLMVYQDSMFTADDYTINLFGIRARITEKSKNETYDISRGLPRLSSLLKTGTHTCVFWRIHGKKSKEIQIDTFDELYVTGIRYASKDEMKAAMKDKTQSPVNVPKNIPPVNKTLTDAISKMKQLK